jgi:hypothetical protein
MSDDLRSRIMAVLLSRDDELDEPGGGWLWQNWDEAHLKVDELADELARALTFRVDGRSSARREWEQRR